MRHIIAFSLLVLFLFSCGSNNENRELKEYLSAFMHENSSVILFGKADVNTILDKMDYQSIPKYGLVVGTQLKEFEKHIDTKSPIFYAVEGPITEQGPAAFYGFVDVKNADELVKKMTKDGYDFDKDGDLNYTQFGDICLGIEKDLGIIIYKKGLTEPVVSLSAAFDRCRGDLSEGKVNDILALKGDIVMGVNFASIYATGGAEIQKLSKAKQDELKAMMEGSYTQTSISFENGAAIIEAKNFFSPELKKKMFLKDDGQASILSKLGHGPARFGFAMNMDMVKLQQLIDDYSPEALSNLGSQLGGPVQMGLMAGGDKALSNLFNGEFGILMMGEPDQSGSTVPYFNAYLGLGKKGLDLAGSMKEMLSMGEMQIDLTKDGIACFSSPKYAPVSDQKPLIPAGCDNYGKKGITGFVNFEGMDTGAFEMGGPAKLITSLKYITFEVDNDGAKVVLKAKKGQENILKQSMEVIVKEFELQMSGMGS